MYVCFDTGIHIQASVPRRAAGRDSEYAMMRSVGLGAGLLALLLAATANGHYHTKPYDTDELVRQLQVGHVRKSKFATI